MGWEVKERRGRGQEMERRGGRERERERRGEGEERKGERDRAWILDDPQKSREAKHYFPCSTTPYLREPVFKTLIISIIIFDRFITLHRKYLAHGSYDPALEPSVTPTRNKVHRPNF